MIRKGFETIAFLALAVPLTVAACQPVVRISPTEPGGARTPEPLTRAAVIKDYLEAWQSLRTAFASNNAALLDRDYTGTASAKLTQAIQKQASLGLTTRYCDQTHDIQIIFYSPEGLSIQLIDRVTYEMAVIRDGKTLAQKKLQAHYVAVLTPSATRWRVRVFEAGPQSQPPGNGTTR